MSAVEERVAALGHRIPEVVAPVAAYVPTTRTGSLVFTAGQLPIREGALLHTGKVGAEVSTDEAVVCARQCALNVMGALKAEIGDLDSVIQLVKVAVFVASAPDFTAQPLVANGASELFAEAFGQAGLHARSAVGVSVLPLDAPVEIEAVFEVR